MTNNSPPVANPAGKTSCCVVGGGPAGMVLAYLLAMDGVDVTLLESHADFAREFRGDTFHASSMDLIDDLGLLEKLDPLILSRLNQLAFTTRSGKSLTMAKFSGMKSRFPYVAIVPQAEFLTMLSEEAKSFPSFKIQMQANVQELIEEGGEIVGVHYKKNDQVHELRADLVVAADGRASRLRKKAGIELITEAPPMDVLWFRLPHRTGDDEQKDGVEIRIGSGTMMVLLGRGDYWQCGFIVLKGAYHDIRGAGLGKFHQEIKELLPVFLHDRIKEIDDWKKIAVLAVQVGRVNKWHRPGFLLIGDAAHVMSPIGGVGINYAIQDAVAAYNYLSHPLSSGSVTDENLAAVQKRREWPTKVIQGIQTMAQKRIVKAALQTNEEFTFPLPLRIISKLPLLNKLPAWVLAYGVRHETIEKRKS
ncbi:MAG: FAD-dependent oxidoreductase [Verrucomicrobia bacterium]|nr:FAD-dependent oxidoreductase [Verrucomicrobiota bacterium]